MFGPWLLKRRLRASLRADANIGCGPGSSCEAWFERSATRDALWREATEPAWLVHLAFAIDVSQSRVVEATLEGADTWIHRSALPCPITQRDWTIVRDRASRGMERLLTIAVQLRGRAEHIAASEASAEAESERAVARAFQALTYMLLLQDEQGPHSTICFAASTGLAALTMVGPPDVLPAMTDAVRNKMRPA